MQHLSIPLKNLKVFEVVSRHLSFTRAAEELFVTPSAISQQIKQLEGYVGASLFTRNTRSLELTAQAKQALPYLVKGFDELYQGVKQLQNQQHDNVLTISVGASFGARWLLSRLSSFKQLHPEIEIRIDATDTLADFARDGVDLAIRHGSGSYPGLEVELLMRDVAFPVCSPVLLASSNALSTPEKLKNHPLLHVDWRFSRAYAPTWEKWFKYNNLDMTVIQHGSRFNMDDMSTNAAIAGMGVALITRAFIINDLATGRLVKPFSDKYDMPTNFHHYLVYQHSEQPIDKIQSFIKWAKQQAKNDLQLYRSSYPDKK